jgi:glycosyltransferase involved in cell wall biosynthesis
MATHDRESPKNLVAALVSIANQTVLPEEIILVLDGPIGPEQAAALKQVFAENSDVAVRTVSLSRRVGLAEALNAGLDECAQPYVARMDSDDIAVPDRFALQWAALLAQPELDLVAGWQAEFANDPMHVSRVKTTPKEHRAIARQLVWRCVISHPTVVVRRSVLERVGGYSAIPYLEDYDLYMRLISAGARFGAVQRPLVLVRVSSEQYGRRGGWRHVRGEWRFRVDGLRRGNLSVYQFLCTVMAYSAFRLLPVPVRRATYRLVRTRVDNAFQP